MNIPPLQRDLPANPPQSLQSRKQSRYEHLKISSKYFCKATLECLDLTFFLHSKSSVFLLASSISVLTLELLFVLFPLAPFTSTPFIAVRILTGLSFAVTGGNFIHKYFQTCKIFFTSTYEKRHQVVEIKEQNTTPKTSKNYLHEINRFFFNFATSNLSQIIFATATVTLTVSLTGALAGRIFKNSISGFLLKNLTPKAFTAMFSSFGLSCSSMGWRVFQVFLKVSDKKRILIVKGNNEGRSYSLPNQLSFYSLVRYKEVATMQEIQKACEEMKAAGQKIEQLWIDAHGSNDGIQLKDERIHAFNVHKLKPAFELLENDASIVLFSCSTAKPLKELPKEETIAEKIARIAGGRKIIAATEDICLHNLEIDPSHPLPVPRFSKIMWRFGEVSSLSLFFHEFIPFFSFLPNWLNPIRRVDLTRCFKCIN